jgi:hypothetical protein
MRTILIAALAALPLAACEGNVKEGESGTAVSINASSSSDEYVAITADGNTGEVAIKSEGFSASVDLPQFKLDSGNFDIGGVKLYPGSKISGVNVNADSGEGSGKVDVSFTAPAAPDKVAAYFKDAFREKGVTTAQTGTSIAGTMADGDAFSIALTPDGDGTKGKINIDGK